MTGQAFLNPSTHFHTIILSLFFLLNFTLALDYPSFNGFFTFFIEYLKILGYQFVDLTSKDIDSFYLETQKWTISGLAGTANSSECGINNPLLGGYGIFSNSAGMTKTYTALPTHTAIYFQITFNLIDKFKNPDYFTLMLDSTSIPGGSSLYAYNSYVTSNTCGGSNSDTTQFVIAGSMPHTAATFLFNLSAKIATGAGSGTLGIRDILLTFVNDSSVTTASSCFRFFDTQLLGISGECSCVKGSYLNSGSCETCDSACENCFGPDASQCYACASGYSFTGTECIKCDSSCLTCSGPDPLQCVTCQDGYWLQPDGSCTVTCDLSVAARQAVGSLQLCYAECTTNQYILWDGTCVDNCNLPLVKSESISEVSFCNKPCDDNEYLYSNGSCLSTCPSPFKKSSTLDVDLCLPPCANSHFLYPDGSCSSKCPAPLVTSTPADGIKRCISPCPNLSDYYYSANKTCGGICSSPSVLQKVQFIEVCSVISEPTLSTNDKNSVDTAKDIADTAGTAANVGVVTSSLLSSQSSGAITLVSLIKMLEYIRYMKINYPPKVEYMMSMQNEKSISLTIDVNLPESIEKKFPDYPLPGNFEKYNLVSNFIVNYWEELFTLVIVLLVLTVSMLLALKAKSVKYVGTYSAKLRDIIKWNFFLIIFCGNVDTVGVFSSLEFRTTHFNSFVSVFGTLLCVFVNLLVLYVMFMIPYIIYSLRRSRNRVLPMVKNLEHKDDDPQRFLLCGVLYMNFREKSVFQHSCMFFILLRVYFFNITIGYLFEYPLAQAILLTLMSVLMLGYFTITRPYKNPLELIKTLTYEAVIAVVNICVLILAIMDHKGIENTESRRRLGDAIIISNVVFNLMAVFYLVVEFVIKVIKVYKLRKTIAKTGWRYWLTIIAFLLEPEELELEDDETPVKIQPVVQIQPKGVIKLEEKLPSAPKKRVSFKPPEPLDDQEGQDSDLPLEKVSSIQRRIALQNSNKPGTLKTNSILSFDGFSEVGSNKNLLTPGNAKSSLLFSQNNLSPRDLLYDQDNNSPLPSPRMLQRSANQFSVQDIDHVKLVNDNSASSGSPVKLDDEKEILVQRNKSLEVNKENRRRKDLRLFAPSSVVLDNSESSSESHLEIGTNNLIRQQSRFSKYSPEKSKILLEEDA